MYYKICKNGIFKSVQGEGANTGKSAIFVRFAGCNMNPRCVFCDEKFDAFDVMSEYDIYDRIKEMLPVNMIVITGGEPTMNDLTPIVDLLKANGFYVGIETNGTNEINCSIDWITCSPKNEYVNIKYADELKFVINKSIEKTENFINTVKSKIDCGRIFLQPKSNCKDMIENCLSMIYSNPDYELSVQLHKFLNIK